MEVYLEKAAAISGIVVMGESNSPVALATVAAIVDGASIDPDLLRMASEGKATIPTATTDERGLFTLEGLEAGVNYGVFAATSGMVSPRVTMAMSGQSTLIEVPVWYLYGKQLTFLNKGGGPPLAPPFVDVESCTSWSHDESVRSKPISPGSAALQLIPGLKSPLLHGKDRIPHTQLILHTSPEVVSGLGPVEFTKCTAGYERETFEVWLEPIGDTIPVERVELARIPGEFGGIEVVVSGLPRRETVHTAHLSPRTLFLRYTESNEVLLQELDFLHAPQLIEPLPAGQVQVQLTHHPVNMPDWSNPIGEVFIQEGLAPFTIDISHLGGVAVELVGRGGAVVSGPVTIDLLESDEKRALRSYTFGSAPYLFYGVEPGEYIVAVHQHFAPGMDEAHSTPFHVVAGELIPVRCTPGSRVRER